MARSPDHAISQTVGLLLEVRLHLAKRRGDPRSADCPAVWVSPAPNSAFTFSIRTRFDKEGEQRAEVRFLVEDEDGSQFTVTVPLEYFGVTHAAFMQHPVW
jgi:hypothetical protein